MKKQWLKTVCTLLLMMVVFSNLAIPGTAKSNAQASSLPTGEISYTGYAELYVNESVGSVTPYFSQLEMQRALYMVNAPAHGAAQPFSVPYAGGQGRARLSDPK